MIIVSLLSSSNAENIQLLYFVHNLRVWVSLIKKEKTKKKHVMTSRIPVEASTYRLNV